MKRDQLKRDQLKRILKILIGIIILIGIVSIGEIALRYISKDYESYVKTKTWNRRLKEVKKEILDTTSTEEFYQQYQSIASSPNYYDSLYHISFLKEVKEIHLTDSLKYPRDTSIVNNPYLLNSIQNINIFKKLVEAHKQNKPLLIYFTAIGCVNCRKIENIFDNEEVKSILEKEFLFVPLCVDYRVNLPQSHWIKNPRSKGKRNLNPYSQMYEVNSFFQIAISRSGTQPVFISLDINRKLGHSYPTNQKELLLFLNKTLEKHGKDSEL